MTGNSTSAVGNVFINLTFTTGWRPDDPPPAGVMVPAPEPFPPGPLRWEARRLDEPAAELVSS